MQAIGYIIMSCGGQYPLFVFAYVLNGFGLGLQVRLILPYLHSFSLPFHVIHDTVLTPLQDAQVNSLTSRLPNASTKMFLMHAFYGLGATVSPLVSTEFVKRVQNRVYLYFCVSLGLAVGTVVALILVFRGRTEDQVVGQRQPDPYSSNRVGLDTPAELATPVIGSDTPREKEERPVHSGGSGGKMKRIMMTPAVHYMAFYILIYVRENLVTCSR